MIKSRTVTAGAASSKYYDQEGYYTPGSEEARAASEWFGRAAKDAGLVGEVDGDKFTELLEGKAPDGQVMGVQRGGERQHRHGLDLTMNAPKEVSILALVFGDDRVVAAHDKVVRDVASYVEDKLMMTRVGRNGSIEVVPAPNVIAGIFRHQTNRDMEPHLHSHTVFTNMVKTELGDIYRSLHNDVIAENALLLTQLYQSGLKHEMKSLGFEAELGRDGFLKVKGLEDLKDPFSQRTYEILSALKERGWEDNGKNRQVAALMTRAKKQKGDSGEFTQVWQKQAELEGWAKDRRDAFLAQAVARSQGKEQGQDKSETPAKEGKGGSSDFNDIVDRRFPAARTSDVREAVDFAVRHVSEREAIYHESSLKVAALRRLDTPDIRGIDQEIGRLVSNGKLFAVQHEKGLNFSDSETLTAERAFMRTYRASVRDAGVQIDKTLRFRLSSRRTAEGELDNKMRLTSLTDGQKEAIKTSLLGEGRFVGVQGYAGTGKTYMLDKMRGYAEKYGYQVEGVAPTNSARAELDKVLPGSDTVTGFLNGHANNADAKHASNRILVVDEAAMISTKDFRDLMQAATDQGIRRVIFQGDVKQLESVGAGVPFKQLMQAGMRVGFMDDIQRQDNDDAKAAVIYAMRGDVRKAFDRVGSVSSVDNVTQEVADRWLALSESERRETGVLVLTNRRRRDVNDLIRAGLSEEGTLSGKTVVLPTIEPLNNTRAAAGDAASYRDGDTVLSVGQLRSYKIKAYELMTVVSRDLENNKITMRREETGRNVTVQLGQNTLAAEKLAAFKDDYRAFQKGDFVKFNFADRDASILKGERGTITGLIKKAVSITLESGQKTEVPLDSFAARGLDYGYTLTAHAYQGKTIKDIIIGMTHSERLATQKALYVQISRVKNQAHIITNDSGKLISRIAKETGESMEALTEVTRSRLQELFTRNAQNGPSQAVQNSAQNDLQNAPSEGRKDGLDQSQNMGFLTPEEQAQKDLRDQAKAGEKTEAKTDPKQASDSQQKTPDQTTSKTPSEQRNTQGRDAAYQTAEAVKARGEQADFLKELEATVERITQDQSRSRGERSR